jgi:hypothetical protein
MNKKITKEVIKKEETTYPIMIPFRDDGYGKGCFYDHFTIQKATKHETKIIINDESHDITNFLNYYSKIKQEFDYGNMKIENFTKKLPFLTTCSHEGNFYFLNIRRFIDYSWKS